MQLVQPGLGHLPGYAAALRRGWNFIGDASPDEQLAAIARSPASFLAQMDDPEAKGPPIRLSDGSPVPRLPGLHRFLWDGCEVTPNRRWRRCSRRPDALDYRTSKS